MQEINKKSKDENVVVRFPPSPTGNLHIGNIRTFLFSYLFARKHEGKIVMRFEDTDRERSKREYEDVALDTLKKLGLSFDDGPFRQSERTDRYVEVLESLIDGGHAYEAEESKDGSGDRVVRLKNPNKQITFNDIVRGEITIDTTDFGDFVIARSKTNPLYHLTVVVDDLDMGITHIIRGEDHITSTPRQMLIIEALGGMVPKYAHLPLIIGKDKKKLGKRHGAVTYQEFEKMGILPEAVVNYLALLGWNPGDDREFFTLAELVSEFSLEKVNNSPAMFDYEKLDSVNRHYMLQMNASVFEARVSERLPEEYLKFVRENPHKDFIINEIIKERIAKFADVEQMIAEGELAWMLAVGEHEAGDLVWKKGTIESTIAHLEFTLDALGKLDAEDFDQDNIKNAIWEYAEQEGRGDVLWPLRFALTGAKRSPDPFAVATVIGKESTIARVQNALRLLNK